MYLTIDMYYINLIFIWNTININIFQIAVIISYNLTIDKLVDTELQIWLFVAV